MTSKTLVEEFLSQRTLALYGASRKGKKFGNTIHRELKAKGYQVFPIHPVADQIDGEPSWRRLEDLPEPVGGAVLVVPPSETEKIVQELAGAGVERVWIQQGAASNKAIRYCGQKGLKVVHGECILMFAEPAGLIHRFHRRIWGWLGKLPR